MRLSGIKFVSVVCIYLSRDRGERRYARVDFVERKVVLAQLSYWSDDGELLCCVELVAVKLQGLQLGLSDGRPHR
jgi:hypothetical protein